MVNSLNIYRAGVVVSTVDIDEQTVFNEKLQGAKLISCAIKNPVAIPIQPEDYIIYKGERFTCNIVPDFTKDSETLAKDYSIVFEAEFYHLLDWFVEHEGNQDFSSYYGTARDHLNLVISSANLKSSGWVVGEVDETEEKSIPYSWTYVRTALDDIATAFGLEYQFTGKTIRMVKRLGRNTGLSFEMGRGKGLHQIKRSTDTNKSSVNRVYGIGGTRNIDSSYRDGTKKNLIFTGEYIQTAEVTEWLNGTGPEVRIKEGKFTDEDIYPQFKGNIASTTIVRDSAGKITSATITDPTINFDVNAQLQPGVKAHVSFLTGSLTGVDFEISSYVPATKTITIIPNTDTNGYILPNDVNLPEVGNQYTFIDMRMPVAYVTDAEGRLKTATQTYLDDNKFDRLIYGVIPDEKQLRDNMITLSVGDLATVVDAEMEVNEILRFVEISYPLVNEYSVTGVIGNQVIYDRVIKLFADAQAVHQQISDIDRRGQEIAKRGAQNLRVLADSVFDVEGNFDSSKFNVGVLSALLGIFGIQSANFLLNKVFITANYNGDPNAVNISAGELFHLEYSNQGNQNVWQMQSVTQAGLITGSKYYVYSKISKTSQVGSFLITTDQIKPDDLPGFYTVRTGLIYPQIDGLRDVDFTYGITTVNGRQIKAGIIQGNTGALIINLDTGEIFGKMTFRASNGTIKDVVTVDNTAALAQANALAAQILADKSLAELADIASDSKLTPNEKVSVSRDLTYINQEYPVRIQEASGYGVSTTAYTNSYDFLFAYINSNNLLFDLNSTSDIVSSDFKNAFANYYTASVNLTKAISDAANHKIDSINVGGRNYVLNSHFYQPLSSGKWGGNYGNEGLSMVDGRLRVSALTTGNFGVYSYLFTIPVGEVTFSGLIYNHGADNVFIYTNIGGYSTNVVTGQKTILTFNNTSSDPIRFFVLASGQAGSYFDVEWVIAQTGNKASDWTPAPEDIQAQLDIAKAATLSQASTDAQAKADAAYNASVAASNAYSNTVSNSAANAAQVAAAADASNKANAAYSAAQAAADAKYNALTGQLGGMAFRSVQAAAGQGVTVVDNGSVLTFLVDASYIRANVIDVGYITGLNLNFVQGSIGGILINSAGILASNGTFYINNQGQLYCTQATVSGNINATSGVIGGFNIAASQISAGGFLLDPSQRMMSFIDNSNGMVASAVGSLNAGLASGYGICPGTFVNERVQSVSVNTALTISAKNGGNGNNAIDILNGNIRVHGNLGFTGYELVSSSGPQTRKYVAGVYIGQGFGNNW